MPKESVLRPMTGLVKNVFVQKEYWTFFTLGKKKSDR